MVIGMAFCGIVTVLPRQAADLARLRVGPRAWIWLVSRINSCAVDGVGHVGAVAVVAERKPVGILAALPDRVGVLGVGDVDRRERLDRRAGRVERLAVGREVALVAERGHQCSRVEHWVTAVAAGVVDRDQTRGRGRIAEHGRQQAPFRVEAQ